MPKNEASEALLAAPLPEYIRDLGLGIAAANAELAKNGQGAGEMTINNAKIELRVAVSIDKESTFEGGIGGNISVFSVNASYARTYGFNEEASSTITVDMAVKPLTPGPVTP